MMTRTEQDQAIKDMEEALNAFYRSAVAIGNHPFIEFAGLMNEYIKACAIARDKGIDFSDCNTHSGKELPMEPYQIEYVNEKLECIFTGRSFAQNPTLGNNGRIHDVRFAVSNDGGKTGVAWRQSVHEAFEYLDKQNVNSVDDYAVVAVRSDKYVNPKGTDPVMFGVVQDIMGAGDAAIEERDEWRRWAVDQASKAGVSCDHFASEDVPLKYKELRDRIGKVWAGRNKIDIQVVRDDSIPAFGGWKAGSLREGTPTVLLNLSTCFLDPFIVNNDREERMPMSVDEKRWILISTILHEVGHALQEMFYMEFEEDRLEEIVQTYEKDQARTLFETYSSTFYAIRRAVLMSAEDMRLRFGEMSPEEVRAVRAVLEHILAKSTEINDAPQAAIIKGSGDLYYANYGEWTDRPWLCAILSHREAELIINGQLKSEPGVRALLFPARQQNEVLVKKDRDDRGPFTLQQPQNVDPGTGWFLLPEGTPLQPGDGFLHPDYSFWTDYECRPAIFQKDTGKETAHTWPWRRRQKISPEDARKLEAASSSKDQEEMEADPSVLLAGLSYATILNLRSSDPDSLRVEAGGPSQKGKYAGWITTLDGRAIVNTEATFDTSKEAEVHMHKIIAAARKGKPDTEGSSNA